MVDLETLGSGSNSVIIALGAVEFDDTGLGRTFYMNIDPQSCVDAGLKMDASTVMWWMQQSDEARAAFEKPGAPLELVLGEFSSWYPSGAALWGNGATFDNVILANAYRALGGKQPWAYWNDRCYRTLKSLYPHVKMERSGTYHNALDDAKSQALHALKLLTASKGL
jgi:exodeoxyribonuclease VIII